MQPERKAVNLQEAERSAWLDEEDGEGEAEDATLIWGTNVNHHAVQRRIRRFLLSYKDDDALDAKYVELIRQVRLDCGGEKPVQPLSALPAVHYF